MSNNQIRNEDSRTDKGNMKGLTDNPNRNNKEVINRSRVGIESSPMPSVNASVLNVFSLIAHL
ncbi:MAG: hypothetical protein ACLVKO_02790 [Dysgonomonas sp.]